jgi:hypothetical protein
MMRTGRSGDRQSPFRVVRAVREKLIGSRSADCIRASGLRVASMGRTYDRNRPTRISAHQSSCPQGAST